MFLCNLINPLSNAVEPCSYLLFDLRLFDQWRTLFSRKEEGFFNNNIFLLLQRMESSSPQILLTQTYISISFICNYFLASYGSYVVSLQVTLLVWTAMKYKCFQLICHIAEAFSIAVRSWNLRWLEFFAQHKRTDKLFHCLVLEAAVQMFADRFGAGDQHSCSAICAHVFRIMAPAWALFPESFRFLIIVIYKYEILLLLLSVSSILVAPVSLFGSVIRRSLRDRSCCLWNVQMWKWTC